VAFAAAPETEPTIGASGIHQIFAPFVESFAADFSALVEGYARHLGDSVPAAFRIDLLGLGHIRRRSSRTTGGCQRQ
jgi:hypothetical protein